MRIFPALTVCAILLLSAGSAQSQEFDFGAKIGFPISIIRINTNTIDHILGDEPEIVGDKPEIWSHYRDPRVGFNISVLGGYNISLRFHLGIEPGYIIKGTAFAGADSKLSLHYLNLPVILKYRISDRIGIVAGPEFSTLLKATVKFDGDSIDLKDYYDDRAETSLNIGLEYQATERFGLGLRYNHGLTKVSETEWTNELGELDSIDKEHNHYVLLYSTIHL